MARPLPGAPLGVYIHFPYCSRLCPYCDFTVFVRSNIPHRGYGDALLRELGGRGGGYPKRALRSIYFGGGTPGLFAPEEIGRVIEAVKAAFPERLQSPEAGGAPEALEITVEVNPEHVSRLGLEALASVGVNRLSYGVQSFDDGILAALGRTHSGAQAREALEIGARAGFDRVSLDLIFAAPGQTLAHFDADLDVVLGLPGVGHVSLYQLTIEPRTVFGRQLARGQRAAPDGELGADCYERAEARLTAAGFAHYEVSSYARPGQRSRHNGLYWSGAEYLGLGVGAHSLRFDPAGRAVRRGNGRDLKAYLGGGAFEAEVERLDDAVHLGERLMVGLRTAEGVDLAALQGSLDIHVLERVGAELRAMVGEGLLRWEGDRISPTARGMALGDSLAERLL